MVIDAKLSAKALDKITLTNHVYYKGDSKWSDVKVVRHTNQLIDPNQTYIRISSKSKDSHFLYLIKNNVELGSAIMSRHGGFIQSISNYDSNEVQHGGSALMETCLKIAKASEQPRVELNATDATGFHYKFDFRFADPKLNQYVEYYLSSGDLNSANQYTGTMFRNI